MVYLTAKNYCVIIIVHTIYRCGHRPQNTTWQAVGWRPVVTVLCKVAIQGWDIHFDSLCGKRSGQFVSVLQLKQVACVPELLYVRVML